MVHPGEDLHVCPPWVAAEDAGAGGWVEGVPLQGGFHPEATEYEDVVEDEATIKYKKTNKNPKKIIKTKTNKNPIKHNKVPLTMLTVNANGMKTKAASLKNMVNKLSVGLFTVQETLIFYSILHNFTVLLKFHRCFNIHSFF